MPTPDPVDTIERFAELSAMLDDPFADEDAILRAIGLDGDAWDHIEARWLERLRTEGMEMEALVRRYGRSYRETAARLRRGAGREPIPETQPTGAGFLSPEVQPWRAEVAEVGREAAAAPPPMQAPPAPQPPPLVVVAVSAHASAVAETLDAAAPLPVPVLPFKSSDTVRSPSPGATVDLDAFVPPAALPFTPPKP